MKHEKTLRQKGTGIAAVILYLIAGVLLLIWPDLMTEITMWALVIVLAAYGIYRIIAYFRMTPEEGASTYSLALALFLLLLAVYIIIDRTSFASIFPRIWGLMLLIGGFIKIQEAIDALRIHQRHWWWLLIGAAISVVLGIFAILRPAFILESIALFIGISLIVEAIIDVILLIFFRKGKRSL